MLYIYIYILHAFFYFLPYYFLYKKHKVSNIRFELKLYFTFTKIDKHYICLMHLKTKCLINLQTMTKCGVVVMKNVILTKMVNAMLFYFDFE